MYVTDIQTVNDLGIFNRESGIYALYDRTATRGGAQALESWLKYPMDDAGKINRRTGITRHFLSSGTELAFDKTLFDPAGQYLGERDERTRLSQQQQGLGQRLSGLIASDAQYKQLIRGLHSTIGLLRQLRIFIQRPDVATNKDYGEERESIAALLSEPSFTPFLAESPGTRLHNEQLAAYDSILRFRHHKKVTRLMQHIYDLDAYLAIGATAREKGYVFAHAETFSPGSPVRILLEDVKHPAVANARGNNISIDNEKNLVFLTGANMAGKSTFMKSVGIAVYLAHAGFPVDAKRMDFTAMDGMFSTINLPDNLGMGASHFYAEVLRVKKVAQELHAGKRLFVLFDEMFRGTNVKDAGEATILVVEGFARKTDSLFIISTHIIEAGDTLRQKADTIQYRYLPTKMDGHKPVYTYRLEEGITEDRHGMVIIRNEGILATLEKNSPK
jgi:DNA mismatch repair ATPase MutS